MATNSKSVQNLCNSGNTFTKNNIVMLIHDEMFQKSWEESELKQLIDLLRSKPYYINAYQNGNTFSLSANSQVTFGKLQKANQIIVKFFIN